MRSKSESRPNQLEPNPYAIPPGAVYSEPWWRGSGYNPISPVLNGGNVSNSSSLDCPNGSESNDVQSLSNDGVNEEEDDANKEPHTMTSSRPVGNCVQENKNMQQGAPALPTMHDECFSQPSHLELVGHSIACASNPYQDPYFGGRTAACGPQPVSYPQFVGIPHARMPLPLEMAQEPVYVNAKQYMGILRRRQARAKAELEKKLIKVRKVKPYLHESRHQHALRRARGTGGRFAKKTGDTLKDTNKEKSSIPGIRPSQSGSSSGSQPLPSDSTGTWNSSASQQDGKWSRAHSTHEAHDQVNDSGDYQNHGFQASAYHCDRGDDGDCSGKQWGSISSNHSSQRPLTIQ